jgi:hypothetical protein
MHASCGQDDRISGILMDAPSWQGKSSRYGTRVPVEEPSTHGTKRTWCCSGNCSEGPVGGLRRGPLVREAWTNRGRVLRKLREPNVGRDYGSHQLAAVPRSVLHDGSPKSRDLLRVFRTAYRSDTHVQQATFGTLGIPSASPVFALTTPSSLVPMTQANNRIAIIILPSQGRGRACGSSS